MAWCGFDELMRSGVVEYANGVARAITTKAKARGIPVHAQVEQERIELQTLEAIISSRLNMNADCEEDRLRLTAFLGLVSVARFLIREHDEEAIESSPDVDYFRDAFDLASLIQQFDNHYESLPKALGHPANAATSLALTFPRVNGCGPILGEPIRSSRRVSVPESAEG